MLISNLEALLNLRLKNIKLFKKKTVKIKVKFHSENYEKLKERLLRLILKKQLHLDYYQKRMLHLILLLTV